MVKRQLESDDIATPVQQIVFSSAQIASELDRDELDPAQAVVVADDDERASPVRVESDRSVGQLDPHLQVLQELSAENIIIK